MHSLHPQARTTPAVRQEIARSTEPTGVLARQSRPPGGGKLVAYETFLIQTVEARPAITMPKLAARLLDEYGIAAQVYAWFTEGFDTPDLRSAKALLNELGD